MSAASTTEPLAGSAQRVDTPRLGGYVGDLGLTFGSLLGRSPEHNIKDWFKDTRVSYVHTARTAIRRACALLNLRSGDEVLVPAYNCGSEVDALLEGGATVRLFRVSRTGEIDLEDLQARITVATKLIYVIHYFGFSQDLAPIVQLCRTRGLLLMEDCALSMLTQVNGRRIGQAGDIAVYNFPKTLPVPDGGALAVNSSAVQDRKWTLSRPEWRGVLGQGVRLVRQGFLRALPGKGGKFLDGIIRSTSMPDVETGPGRRPMPESYYCHPGLTDRAISRFSAAVLERTDLSQIRECRRRNFSRLLEQLSGAPKLSLLYNTLPEGVCPLYLPILVERARKLAFGLAALSIPALPWWSGYNRKCHEWDAFPDACYLKDHLVALPVHQQLSDYAIDCIAREVKVSLQ